MEVQTYNENFNILWEKSNELNHWCRDTREKIGEMLIEMVDKKLLVYIGEGHRYGKPFKWIPISCDGTNEYVMIKPTGSDIPIKYLIITNDYDQKFIEWKTYEAEKDFMDRDYLS